MHLSLTLLASASLALVSAIINPCTTTSYTAGFSCPTVATEYLAMHTATASVDCGGCSHIAIENIGGHGPVCAQPTEILIDSNLAGTTTTEFACLPTPNPLDK